MNDIFQPEISLWHKIEAVIRETCHAYGFSEIRTPILEQTELFKRGVGSDTDIVEKEMYSFEDRNGDHLTLRPEGTASVVRALAEHNLLNENPVQKLYYMGPMFRHERPQKGRYRQFYQFGIESIGPSHAFADVEVMALQMHIFKKLGVSEFIELRISSVGCEQCRPQYKQLLVSEMEKKKSELPEDVIKRMSTNPQRVFDHKDEKVQKLAAQFPVMTDHLCDSCQTHLKTAQEGLKALHVPFVLDPKIVRGLDYYTQTAFEFVTDKLGAQATVCGGGRYNKLIAELGGPESPAVGFGVGIERLALLVEQVEAPKVDEFEVMFIYPDERGLAPCFQYCAELRSHGVRAEMDYQGRSMKAQMKRADKIKANKVVIIGSQELDKGVAVVRYMNEKKQEEIGLSKLVAALKNK